MKRAKRSCPPANSTRLAVSLLSALVVVLLASCSTDRWAAVEPGEYTSVQGPRASIVVLATLQIDRERQIATFSLYDGPEVVVSFMPRDSSQWPSGCPANLGSTRMEVLDIAADRLVVGSVTFDTPILVRNCPPNPIQVVLREDGVIGGSGTACSHQENCLVFEADDLMSK